MNSAPDNLEQTVEAHYPALYRFALSLTGSESDACDLTQSTCERFLRNPGQIRDGSKLKTWLFTTLYRSFLGQRRRAERFPHLALDGVTLPAIDSTVGEQLDAGTVSSALAQIEEPFRSVLTLFYLEDHSYREIAEILNIPVGTVMSRLSRGKALLRALLADKAPNNIIPLPLRVAS